MPRRFSVSESIVIGLEAAAIYQHVSDPTQTSRWSPENTGATLPQQSAVGPLVGATFIGQNKRHGFRWCTQCTVTAADPGRRFAFQVNKFGLRRPRLNVPIASWEYSLEPVEGGTRVTETWTDDRSGWPDFAATIFDRIVTRKKSFADFNARNIHITLRNLKASLEQEHQPQT
ncbi:Polyketide cyclase / dehydrase and lipid transport [Frankineae bacterium MT45]|nr:Polyketide cyclase / dehydrase and lipid transport [Frankineae bacterium MT45]